MATMLNKKKVTSFLVRWEMVLVYLFILINVYIMITSSESYFAAGMFQSIIRSSLIYAMMIFGMLFILLLGDIDVSVASIMIMSAMTMGYIFQWTNSAFLAILCGIVVGALCGLFNGYLVSKFKMPAVIVTIATQMLFRGIVRIILGDKSLNEFPSWFSNLSWDNVLGIPITLICFAAVAVIFGLILHRSSFGRKLYFMGNNPVSTYYSGVNTMWTKVGVFVIMGVMAAITAIFYVGRYPGINYNTGTGIEMDVIAICVLGGVSTAGGKGKIFGPVIAAFDYGFLRYALELAGVDSMSVQLVTGLVLIIAVIIPLIDKNMLAKIERTLFCKGSQEIYNVRLKMKEDINELNNKKIMARDDKNITREQLDEKLAKYDAKIEDIKKNAKARSEAIAKDMSEEKELLKRRKKPQNIEGE